MRSGDHFRSNLKNLIWKCAADLRFWPEFLAALAEATHSTHAMIVLQPNSGSQGSAFVGMNPKLLHTFKKSYCRHCKGRPCKVIAAPGLDTLRGLLMDPDAICTPPRNVVSKKLLRIHVVPFQKSRHFEATLNLFKPAGSKPFLSREVTLVREMIPHMRAAAEINHAMSSLQTERDVAWAILDRMPIGVILVTKKGKPLMMNRNAQTIVEREDGISLMNGILKADREEETRALYRLIDDKTAATSNPDVSILRLIRSSGERALSVAVTPYESNKHFVEIERPAAVLFITDPEHAMETKANALRRIYDLTPAEARLASLLTQGRDLKSAAKSLHITYSSARNQLKNIFAKTGAGRQSELVRLLLSSPATIHSFES